MKKLAILFLSGFIILTITPTKNAKAALFSQMFMRLDRTKSNTPLSGTVCATPSNSGVEDKVIIDFPADFSINNNPSNFSTNTSRLPAGAVPWPGIGSLSNSITGKSVTLVSDDLTALELYCFNFTANSSNTGETGDRKGHLYTKTSSNTDIDTLEYALSINSDDQIQVHALVPAKSTDYFTQLSLLNSPRPGGYYPENTQMEYRITYGSYLSYPTSITIEASWSLGTIEGQINPSVNALEYVNGSATNAYNNTPPVIDVLNRKITWEIPVFPGNTVNQSITFRFWLLNNFTQNKTIDFTVSGRTLFPGGATPYSSNTSSYKNSKYIPVFNIGIREITSNSATVFVGTNIKTSKLIRYGRSINNLNNQVYSLGKSYRDNLILTNLKASTKYYFRVYVTDENGKQTVSDIYSFETAQESTPLLADSKSLVAASMNTIISPFSSEKNNYLVIPVITPLQFKFSMLNKNFAKNVEGIIRNKNLLGDSTFTKSVENNVNFINLIEVEKGVYSGNIISNQKPGNYELFARILDINGNVIEQKIADMKVVDKFKVISDNKKPIEGARVLIYIYNPTTRTYQIIPSNSLNAGNPLFTDNKGELDLVLPQGIYKAEVSDLRHSDKTMEFIIGSRKGQEYPLVILEKTGITPLGLFNYYKRGLNDVFIFNTKNYSTALTGSSRFFDLVALLSLTGLVILTFFAFSKRHHIPLFRIPSYFYYLLDKKSRYDKYIHGVVYDENDKPISQANVYLTDKANEEIISNTKTNKRGEFYFKKSASIQKNKSGFFLMAMARNFKPSPVFEYHEKEHLKFRITLEAETGESAVVTNFNHLVSIMIGMSFEVLLILSFVFELLFLNSFGLLKTLPFLLISTFNLVIWTLHQKNK
jgi:hypothetical protein